MDPSLAELRAHPHDRDRLLVHADRLASLGDPRGELIAVQDAEAECTAAGELFAMRARANELIAAHPQLRPPWPVFESGVRRIWPRWRGGFVRSLELLVDRPTPRVGVGLWGWTDALARVLLHPSLALIEQLTIRFDLRGGPTDERSAALDVLIPALARVIAADPGPRPQLAIHLHTNQAPDPGARQQWYDALTQLCAELGQRNALRGTWFSVGLSATPTPTVPLVRAVAAALGQLPRTSGTFDLIWFDRAGGLCDALGVQPGLALARAKPDDASARIFAKSVRDRVLVDTLGPRRIAAVFEAFAGRLYTHLGGADPWSPGPIPTVERLEPGRVATWMTRTWGIPGDELAAVLTAEPGLELWSASEDGANRRWAAVVGLSGDQLLLLARVMA